LEPDAEPEDDINDESHVDWARDPNEVRVEECFTFIAAYVGAVGLVVEEQRLKKHWYESQKDTNVWIIGVTECPKAKSPQATSLHNQQYMYISPYKSINYSTTARGMNNSPVNNNNNNNNKQQNQYTTTPHNIKT
jgi:hypothetical protein